MNNVQVFPPGTEVLVTGATGFTGSHITRKLAARGIKVRAIARESSDLRTLTDLPIEWFRGEVYDPGVVERAARGAAYIFHTAAAYREAKLSDDVYRNVHVRSTGILAAEAKKNPAFKRFVHLSTVGVHGHIENPPATEITPFHPGDIYQATKLEGELSLRDFAKREHLPITIIRPAAIFGPGDRRLLKLFRLALQPIFPVLGYGKCLYHLIHVDDLTDFMIRCATDPRALGETFICGNSESIPLPEIARTVARARGKRARIMRIPAWPFFILGDLCEMVCKPLGIEPPIYRRRVAFFTKDRSFDTSKMRTVTGFTPRYSNEEGITDTVRWYMENGWIHA